jgi:AraC family transcriptional regulator of adaptative response / methylphosphotriester-DNA alkyltransferase methyltransferase
MKRPKEIVVQYLKGVRQTFELSSKSGNADSTFEIQDIASIMHIHPTHLSNTISEQLGKSPCDIYEERLMNIAKELIRTTDLSISE